VPPPSRFERHTRSACTRRPPELVAVTRRSPEVVARLVRSASAGNDHAWAELVDEFEGLLRAVARAHRLAGADAADVAQTTWMRLAEHISRLEDPGRVGAWLATTARRESLRLLRRSSRVLPSEDLPEPDPQGTPGVDRGLLARERDAALWSAFRRLRERDQALLRMLVADARRSYEDISAALAMPIGSIGPTRARALERLRKELDRASAPVDLAA